jgi:hypothetical protein
MGWAGKAAEISSRPSGRGGMGPRTIIPDELLSGVRDMGAQVGQEVDCWTGTRAWRIRAGATLMTLGGVGNLSHLGILYKAIKNLHGTADTAAGQNTSQVSAGQVLFDDVPNDRAPEAVLLFVALVPDVLQFVEVVLNQAIQAGGLGISGPVDSLEDPFHMESNRPKTRRS